MNTSACFFPGASLKIDARGHKSEMCDQQEKDHKRGKTANSKSQQIKQHHQSQGHHHHCYQQRLHQSDDTDSHDTGSTAEDNILGDHRHQFCHDKTHHSCSHHYHHKQNCRHVSLSESSLSSSNDSSSSSSYYSSSSTSSTSFSSSSSSFSSSSSASSSSSSLSSDNSSEDRCPLKKTQHSQSCTDISGKHRYFDEGDDTDPLIDKRGYLNKHTTKQKRERDKSSKCGSSQGTLKNSQKIKRGSGNDGSFRKAKSMEALTRPKEQEGKQDEDEQEKMKSEARKNLMKEKMKFSAFLNEITRQVLSPMRLTTLGVTDAQRPCSPHLASVRSSKVDSSTDKPGQERSRPASADSVTSSKYSHTSRHSTRLSQSKSFHHLHSHCSTDLPHHMYHRPRSCTDLSCLKSHHSRAQTPQHRSRSPSYYHHHQQEDHTSSHGHHEDCNSPRHHHHHGHHHTHPGDPHGPTYHHSDPHHTSHHYRGHYNNSQHHHHGDGYNSTHKHGEHQIATHHHHGDPRARRHYRGDHYGHAHHNHRGHAYHHGAHHNPTHYQEGHHTLTHHHGNDPSSVHHHHSNLPKTECPTTPNHHGHHSLCNDHGDHPSSSHQHRHRDHHNPKHSHHHEDHPGLQNHSFGYHHHHGDHHSESQQHNHGDYYIQDYYYYHGEHHNPDCHYHHGDHPSVSHQHHHDNHLTESHQHHRGDHQSSDRQHRHGDHHSESHQHHHGDHRTPDHQHHHENHHNPSHQHHHRDPNSSGQQHFHGDHQTQLHQQHPGDHHSEHHEHNHGDHHRESPQHHHGDHYSPGHQHHHGEHHSESPQHHHGDHYSPGHQHHHGDHHSESPQHHHGDHHSPGQKHHHGDHHNESPQHHHGDHHSPGQKHHHGDHHNESPQHHHGDHHSPGHQHHHGDHHNESPQHHHGDNHSPGHQHHHGDHHNESPQHHHGFHHSPGHQHHHGDHHNESPQHHHGDHHSPGHQHHHGDHHNESPQHHHGEHHSESHHHGDHYNTSHHQGHCAEPQLNQPQSKNNHNDHDGLDDHHTDLKGHSANSPSSHRKADLPRNSSSPSYQDEEQTSFTGSSLHKENARELGTIMILQEQNEGLHQSLLKTAVRMECLGEEFMSSQKILETELHKTRMELGSTTQKLQSLHDNCSSTQQTNNLLEQKLQSVVQSMEGERERLNRRIVALTEQLADVKFANSVETLNVTPVLHKTGHNFDLDDAINQVVHPITPPPAQFMDSHNYEKTKTAAQEQTLGSVPEEEESDWSEIGEETPRFTLTGSKRSQAWRLREVDADKDSESGGEEIVRQPSPCPWQIPHLQFTIHNEILPAAQTNAHPSAYMIPKCPNFGSAILIRSASLEEIPLAHHHMQKELRGTEAMMDLHYSGSEAIDDLDNEIIHHWKTSNDRERVTGRPVESRTSEVDSNLARLQSAEQILSHLLCEHQSSEGKGQGRAEVHGWTGGIPDELLKGERTQL